MSFKQTTDQKKRYDLANYLIRTIAIHTIAEESVLYPQYPQFFSNGIDLAAKSVQEHQIVKEGLFKLDAMHFQDQAYEPLMDKIVRDFKGLAMRLEEKTDWQCTPTKRSASSWA